MQPNPKNFCGGNYQDWIEVMLTPKCNGQCKWCVDKDGFHPKEQVSWHVLVDRLEKVGKKNVILLGGEPTLYTDLPYLVRGLVNNNKNVYITTNGSRMTWLAKNVYGLTGINISIHHYDLDRNKDITGLKLGRPQLKANIDYLWWRDKVPVRFNCTLEEGQIDSKQEIMKYLAFAKRMGAKSVRFAELKHGDSFVDLYEIFGNEFGLTNNPYEDGCSTDAVIDGMPVSFRQMCGIQTSFRPAPINPQPQADKKTVLYYNGVVYNGWQTKEREEIDMGKKLTVKEILERVKSGKMSIETAEKLMKKRSNKQAERAVDRYESVHCQY